MEFDFSDISQSIFEEINGSEETKRTISEETAKVVSEDTAQKLIDKRKEEFSSAAVNEAEKFSAIGGGAKKTETYEVKETEVKEKPEERKTFYGSSSTSSPTSRFGSTTTTSSTQTSAEKKAKETEIYVTGLQDELNGFSQSVRKRIGAEASLQEMQRNRENDQSWTAKELQESHEMFLHTRGGRYITKESKARMTAVEATNMRKLRREFERDKDIIGFFLGGLKLWE